MNIQNLTTLFAVALALNPGGSYNQSAPEQAMTYLGNYMITAYTWTGNPCANGEYPVDGITVASNALPFGVTVYIDGVGYRTVQDRGPEYLGSEWLDLYMDSEWDCVQWGIEYRDVWLVAE